MTRFLPPCRRVISALSPYNLVRLILGERLPTDSDRENVYTRAASTLNAWIANGILEREAAPSLYAYYQRFTVPDTGQILERKGFIGLGALEEYSAGIVHRHEQTLSGPKKDRLELVRHTRAQFELLFLLYPDPDLTIDKILDAAVEGAPVSSSKTNMTRFIGCGGFPIRPPCAAFSSPWRIRNC